MTFTFLDTLGHAEHGGRDSQSLILFRFAVVVVAQLARPWGDVVSMFLSQACHTVQGAHTNDILSKQATIK